MTQTANALTMLQAVRRATLKPVPRRNLIEWADEFRRLSKRAAAQPGRWRSAAVPMALGPMLAVTDPRVRTITAMAPTQEFKTELLLNAAGYFVHQDPAPILIVLPTDKLGESFSKDRLQPMLSETPALSVVSPDDKSRTSDSTLTRKAFSTGAVIDIVGANSPTDLSSRPKRVVLADEIDKYPPSAGKEGDPLTLAEKRQSTFWNAKSIRACSPTQKGFSRVGREYAMSDQRKLHVRCPHCGDAQPLDFKRVRWDKDENGQHRPETAGVTCRSCGSVWTEDERRAAVMAVAKETDFGWRQTRPFRCCGEDHKPLTWSRDDHWNERGEALCPTCGTAAVPVRHAGFNASRIYSLTVPLSAVVEEFLAAKDDPTLLQPFVNTTLAEEWEESSVKVDPQSLLARRAVYGPDDVPAGVMILTAGIDTQDNRLEVEVVGWGKGWESWGIQYAVIYGDPALPQVWRELDQLLLRTFTREDGRPMRIQAACIDSGGHHAEQVFQFTQPRFGRRVYAIKGTGQPGAPIWPRRASRSKDRKTLFIVGSSSATDQVYGWLRVDSPGAGFCHFSADYDEAYFNGLLAEKAVVRKIGGQMVRAYECPPGARNEPLDCRKYALAALKSMNVAMPDAPVEDAPQAAPAASDNDEAKPQPAQPAPPPPRPKRKRRSALNHTGGSWL